MERVRISAVKATTSAKRMSLVRMVRILVLAFGLTAKYLPKREEANTHDCLTPLFISEGVEDKPFK